MVTVYGVSKKSCQKQIVYPKICFHQEMFCPVNTCNAGSVRCKIEEKITERTTCYLGGFTCITDTPICIEY